jgi:hypothetical protein
VYSGSTMNSLSQILCFCAAVVSGPQPQPVMYDGFISYRYEVLGGGKYLLRLSTTDLGLDSDSFREMRMRDFAQHFADRTCQGRYQLVAVDPSSWSKDHPIYAKKFVFRCR